MTGITLKLMVTIFKPNGQFGALVTVTNTNSPLVPVGSREGFGATPQEAVDAAVHTIIREVR